jgi:hypothetical protein
MCTYHEIKGFMFSLIFDEDQVNIDNGLGVSAGKTACSAPDFGTSSNEPVGRISPESCIGWIGEPQLRSEESSLS